MIIQNNNNNTNNRKHGFGKLDYSDKMLNKITSTLEINDFIWFIWGKIDIERSNWSSILFLVKKFSYQNKWVLYAMPVILPKVYDTAKEETNLTVLDNGVFWMSFEKVILP